MTEKQLRWNRFIEEICSREIASLSPVQRTAVLCFWYDAEMNSGGHSGYFDCYPNTDEAELVDALLSVGNQEIADNYQKAVSVGKLDDWQQTDMAFGAFSPSLCSCLQEYVERYKGEIFDEK